MTSNADMTPSCPVPLRDYPHVLMAHGGGGTLTQQLLEGVFLPAFRNPALAEAHDGAVLEVGSARVAFSTDSYVVRPLFFPGGDIGSLAVNGTVNDLAMCGARPRWLSAGFIIEEGLPMAVLTRVVESMRLAAANAGVEVATGDTKVVDRGKGDQLFINTAGIGLLEPGVRITPARVQAGDALILSGDVGRHGMAIMSVREGLAFETPIESDCAPLWGPVAALLASGAELHCLRDLTRGGLSSALNEVAASAGVQLDVEEAAVPVSDNVRGACELLGLDPLYVANEGRFVAWVPSAQAEAAVQTLRAVAGLTSATIIGRVSTGTPGLVTLRSRIGTRRILDRLSGEQLPRIC
jgi:hydrogenase expression/formation protein HypE